MRQIKIFTYISDLALKYIFKGHHKISIILYLKKESSNPASNDFKIKN